jgi:uncharacterized protein YukE
MGGAGGPQTANFGHLTLDGGHLNNAISTSSSKVTQLQEITGKLKLAQTQIVQDWTNATGAELATNLGTIYAETTAMEQSLQHLNTVLQQACTAINDAEGLVAGTTLG